MNIYFYGNCQMTALGQMLLEQYPKWTVSSSTCPRSPPSAKTTLPATSPQPRQADVVVAQPIGEFRNEPQLSTETLRAALPGTTQFITLPSIVFEGTHAAFTYLPDRLDGYYMHYHNSHTVDMMLRGYSWKDIGILQASPDFYSRAFVENGIEASLAALRAREALHATTIRVSPIIGELCHSMIVMNAINTPASTIATKPPGATHAASRKLVCADPRHGGYDNIRLCDRAARLGRDGGRDPVIPAEFRERPRPIRPGGHSRVPI